MPHPNPTTQALSGFFPSIMDGHEPHQVSLPSIGELFPNLPPVHCDPRRNSTSTPSCQAAFEAHARHGPAPDAHSFTRGYPFDHRPGYRQTPPPQAYAAAHGPPYPTPIHPRKASVSSEWAPSSASSSSSFDTLATPRSMTPVPLPAAPHYHEPTPADTRMYTPRPEDAPPVRRQSLRARTDDGELSDGDQDHERRHVCPHCDKRFNRPSSLRTHLHTHTGSKPFQCPHPGCGRYFNVNSNMRRHYRTHAAPKTSRRRKNASAAAPADAGSDDESSGSEEGEADWPSPDEHRRPRRPSPALGIRDLAGMFAAPLG